MFRSLFRFFRARPPKTLLRQRNNVTGPERLERRSVLSAGSLTAEIELTITGRDVQFSPAGLPTAMAGDVYLNGQQSDSSRPIGQYQEVLTPILFDVNGDAQPDLIGTTGVATFTFFASAAFPAGLASVTTANVSYIQGVSAAGELLVGSVGTIASGTGLARNLSGNMTSTSTVAFYPSFSMHTDVTFEVSGLAARLLQRLSDVLPGLGRGRDQTGERDWHDRSRHRDTGDARHASVDHAPSARGGHDQHSRAVDHVLDSGVDDILLLHGAGHRKRTDDAWDLPLAA